MSEVKEDTEVAIELCDAILSLVDQLPERAEEFADSIQTKAINIKAFVEKHDKVTPGQITALENMKSGAEKWIR